MLSAGLFFGENCLGNPPSSGPRSKAASALILKLLSASQRWQHKNKKTKNSSTFQSSTFIFKRLSFERDNEVMEGEAMISECVALRMPGAVLL